MSKVLFPWEEDSFELLGYGNEILFIESYIRKGKSSETALRTLVEVWKPSDRNMWYIWIKEDWAEGLFKTISFKTAAEAINFVDSELKSRGYSFASNKALIFI